MCTLTLAWQVLEDASIAVAANRDESLERSAEPPGLYSDDPRVLAPRDTRAGGTWIGVNEHGVVAGITNRWTDADLAGDRSRGLLVGDVLACSSTTDALEVVTEAIETLEYDAFNLVIADATDAVCLEWDGTLERTDFEPGVHVVVNVGVDDRVSIPSVRRSAGERQADNARRVRRALAVDSERADEWLERAKDVLGDHDYGVCVHGEGFGTRSSSVIAVDETTLLTYEFADGPPCRTSYAPVDVIVGPNDRRERSHSSSTVDRTENR